MKTYAAVAGMLFLSAAVHFAIVAGQDRAARETQGGGAIQIPPNIGGYRQMGADIPQEDRVRELLQTSAILMRDYAAPAGEVIRLAMVHAESTRGSLHFPEVCLVGQGWEIEEQYTAPVGFLFTAKHLVLLGGNHREAVLYWFKTGENLTGSFFLNSWRWIGQKIQFKDPATTMIRISTTIGKQGKEAAFDTLSDFATHLCPLLLGAVR